MPNTAIKVDGLGKRYKIGALPDRYFSLRESLTDAFQKFYRPTARTAEESSGADYIWALKEASFQVEKGEVVGIIGPNGAGKSTLLKILSRITEPTQGRASIFGRVGSLLEVGTGFHPELTGRENIYLNGAILGMRRAEIERKFDEIVDFSGVEKFIDTPVKRYSTGMQMRLAFGVAAHLEPEILIVDEVLAVGDAQFQKKCIGKMSAVAGEGRTVLFVSHNMDAVMRLCSRGIVLADGRVAMDGAVEKAVDTYLSTKHSLQGERIWSDPSAAPGNGVVRLQAVRTRNKAGDICSEFDVREPVELEIDYKVLQEGHQLSASVEFIDVRGRDIFHSFDEYPHGPWNKQEAKAVGLVRTVWTLPEDLLNEGSISVNLTIYSPPKRPNETPHIRATEIISFTVLDQMDPTGVRGNFPYEWGWPATRPRLACRQQYLSRESTPLQ